MINMLLYLEVDLLAIGMMLIVQAGIRRFSSFTVNDTLFRLLMASVVAILLVDIVTHIADGATFPGARLLNEWSEAVYFTLTGVLSAIWCTFAWYRAYGSIKIMRKFWLLFWLPCIALAVFSLLTPFFHFVFYVDEANIYHRSWGFVLQSVIAWGYLVLGSIILLLQARKATAHAKRHDLYMLASFSLYPLIGSVLQTLCYGITLVWPLTACALMLIYMDQQNRRVSIDALTGVNNRGRMDQYLAMKMNGHRQESLFVLLMDVDSFKNINDAHGHAVGDKALLRVAEALRRAAVRGQHRDFVARYGGDEFAVVGNRPGEAAVKALVAQIHAELEAGNCAVGENEPQVALSIGYAIWQEGQTAEMLLRAADESMYAVKRARHRVENDAMQ